VLPKPSSPGRRRCAGFLESEGCVTVERVRRALGVSRTQAKYVLKGCRGRAGPCLCLWAEFRFGAATASGGAGP
jgi:hypothetical protein